MNREHAAGVRLLLWNALNRPTHAGDIQDIQIGAAEHHTGQIAHGEFYHAVDAPVRRIANDASAKHMGIPDVAFRIDRGAVERASIITR